MTAAADVKKFKIVALDTGMFRRLFPGERADLKPDDVAEKVVDLC